MNSEIHDHINTMVLIMKLKKISVSSKKDFSAPLGINRYPLYCSNYRNEILPVSVKNMQFYISSGAQHRIPIAFVFLCKISPRTTSFSVWPCPTTSFITIVFSKETFV